ncbi:MBOAT family O-acyltransferase [Paenibacillus chitinolyticus]|uniref:MBOAT family O-acyltransferase n=1 Tax=Paenibacillus chitinolyticus TaxID=79263 RepID=UPI00366D7DF4
MVFSSLMFLYLFLPLTLLLYYVSPKQFRNAILLIVSLLFYAWGEPVYIVLMIFSTLFGCMNGLLIEKYRNRKRIARTVFMGSLLVDLGMLGFFKYAGFVVNNLNEAFGLHMNATDLPLPLGISFYTFQTLSYIIDVYQNKIPAQKNPIAFGAYVSMFPQLIAGPIVKYGDVAGQLRERKVTLNDFGEGARLFIRGLAKKVLLANNIGLLWTSVKAESFTELSVLSAWISILAFTLQIYFDFSGYSDMARGLGRMLGFDFMKNFNYPYISRSVTEFWRRWHISLGSWFREYVYIPLGGNRIGRLKQLRNMGIVWLLTGLWHGANWNFILWGLYFGFFISLEKLYVLNWLKQKPAFIGHLYTLVIVIVGWVIFENEQLPEAVVFIGILFGIGGHVITDMASMYALSTNFLLLIVCALCATPLPGKALSSFTKKYKKTGALIIPGLYALFLLLSTAYLVNATYNPFLYFRF